MKSLSATRWLFGLEIFDVCTNRIQVVWAAAYLIQNTGKNEKSFAWWELGNDDCDTDQRLVICRLRVSRWALFPVFMQTAFFSNSLYMKRLCLVAAGWQVVATLGLGHKGISRPIPSNVPLQTPPPLPPPQTILPDITHWQPSRVALAKINHFINFCHVHIHSTPKIHILSVLLSRWVVRFFLVV